MAMMTPAEIAAARPCALPDDGLAPLARARRRMEAAGQWNPSQLMGRRWPIGCVALEVTQRCNLDCTLCYLSEMSEAVRDTPIEEIFRRIDAIFAQYGPNTDVQVTGGDPTLRARPELVAIVRRIRDRGMRPALFTNGIKATRDLLAELCEAGLVDVAFHVDTTQQRKGFDTEADLDAIRTEYIERARGLPLAVYFNTTVHAGNFAAIPDLVRFFVRNSDTVRLASFQLQADTGRGIDRERAGMITQDTVGRQIEAGAGTRIAFDVPGIGHPACNRYAMTLVVNGRVHDLFDDRDFIVRLFEATKHLTFDRTNKRDALRTFTDWILANPAEALRSTGWLGRKLWAMKADLAASGARANKLSFFIHNFMGATQLEHERIAACSFMVATADGPVSMCLHNAKRDAFILQKLRVGGKDWDPLTGTGDAPRRRVPLKGRARVGANP